MQLISESLAGLKLGAPQVHLNLALFPLIAEFDRTPDYLLLDEALSRKLARVSEVSAEGRVPELDYGRVRHLHERGLEIVFFDKRAKARLAHASLGAAREAARLTRTYAIVGSNGVVITVGHRYRRVTRA